MKNKCWTCFSSFHHLKCWNFISIYHNSILARYNMTGKLFVAVRRFHGKEVHFNSFQG